MKIKELYQELLNHITSEGEYLKRGEIEERDIIKFTDKKKILIDLINKNQTKDIDNNLKNDLLILIEKIKLKENENRQLYIFNMEKVKKNLKSLKNEEKLKNTYYNNINDEKHFDKKK